MSNDSLIGKPVRVLADGREVIGYVRSPSPKYPQYPRIYFEVNGEADVVPFTWDAVKRAIETKEVLLA